MALAGLETNSMNRNACSSEARTPRMRSSCALTAVGLYLSFTGNATRLVQWGNSPWYAMMCL